MIIKKFGKATLRDYLRLPISANGLKLWTSLLRLGYPNIDQVARSVSFSSSFLRNNLHLSLHFTHFSSNQRCCTDNMAPVLAWTVCAYRKPGMSEEEYHTYMSEKHGPLVKGLMVKYGMISFAMVSPS